MGSSSNRELVEKFLLIFSKLPYIFICTVAYYLPEFTNKKYAENIYIYGWLPTEALNKYIDASIIHGGEGTVQTACMSGKPFIGLGLQMEQRYNLQICEEYGNAIQLRKKEITQKLLSQKMARILYEPNFIMKADKLQKLMNKKSKSTEIAAEIICSNASKRETLMASRNSDNQQKRKRKEDRHVYSKD